MRHIRLSLFILFLFTTCIILGQQTTIGGGPIYNFQTRSIGIDVRTEYPLRQINILDGVIIAPQISYYPWFNKVHEFYIGSSVHLGVYSYKKWTAYGLGNISYNGWINHNESAVTNANFSNIGFEIGAGITKNACTRPFVEYRYNFRWREGNIRLGIVHTFNCTKRGMVPCPKIPKLPNIDKKSDDE